MALDFTNVFESLRVLVLGMAGIFVVMMIISLSVSILNRFSKAEKEEESD